MAETAVDVPQSSSLGKRPHEEVVSGSSKRPRLPEQEQASGSVVAEAQSKEQGNRGDNAQKRKAAKKGANKSRKAFKEEGKDGRRGTRRGGTTEGDGAVDGQPKAERLPKRACALLIGFCGEGYNGMQIQPDPNLKTIENTLFDALVKVGAVSQDNADDPVKVKINRAARTDAGVHAAGNLVSMKLIVDIPGVTDLVARVNDELPPEIRVWNYVRTRNSFQARSACDSRKYTYFFPSYLLLPAKPTSGMHKNTVESTQPPHPFWADSSAESTPAEDLRRKRQWRASPDDVTRFREFAQKFEGTHNFHNFTVGRDFKDKSCIRFMRSIEVADPVVYGETEWISVLLHGQSFMLHQIVSPVSTLVLPSIRIHRTDHFLSPYPQRKMICVMILAYRSNTPLQLIEELFGPRNILAPKMPALGLLLEYPIFESYNRKITADNEKMSPTDPNFRQPIDFEAHRDEIEKFKQEWIYTRVRATEQQIPIFDEWIRSIDKYAGKDLTYLGPKGIIPSEAVIKQGERRDNPFREKRKFDAVKFVEGDAAVDDDAEGDAEVEEEGQNLGKAELTEMEG
ncbi:tRNA pseudouridine synthase [Cristinia sonorae]|uniref:tRNA pseudouridine synthase n=1 Tax=Cristinia sonorae TaxID=1940300 RepID=A0A8K0UU02_9AGAR|nr:tRNA pseudouridine synthase [Cristinia sonorae]